MMKKLLVLLFALALVFTFAACGNGDNGADEYENGDVYENGAAANSAVADFLAEHGDEIRGMTDAMTGAMGADGRVELEAGSGNELVYRFIYGSEFDFDVEGMGDMLAETLSTMGSFFEMLAETFRDELELEYMRITVRYYDHAENLIASESFDSAQ